MKTSEDFQRELEALRKQINDERLENGEDINEPVVISKNELRRMRGLPEKKEGKKLPWWQILLIVAGFGIYVAAGLYSGSPAFIMYIFGLAWFLAGFKKDEKCNYSKLYGTVKNLPFSIIGLTILLMTALADLIPAGDMLGIILFAGIELAVITGGIADVIPYFILKKKIKCLKAECTERTDVQCVKVKNKLEFFTAPTDPYGGRSSFGIDQNDPEHIYCPVYEMRTINGAEKLCDERFNHFAIPEANDYREVFLSPDGELYDKERYDAERRYARINTLWSLVPTALISAPLIAIIIIFCVHA